MSDSLIPEFQRNSEIRELRYDTGALNRRVIVAGLNPTSESIIKQLLAFGFRNIYLWSPERDGDLSGAARMLRGLDHISPYYRHSAGYSSLEARAITAGLDSMGFSAMENIAPDIMINTMNSGYASDMLLARFLSARRNGLFIDAHTVMDHGNRLYGMNIQTALSSPFPQYDEFAYMEDRDISAFEAREHDPLMAVICASYAAAFAARYALDEQSSYPGGYFERPTSFSLFPFAADPLMPGPAAEEVRYKGFFRGKGIYLAGLGGGSLVLDTLLRVFDADILWGVDRDRIERTNLNRLIHFADEAFIGRKKTEAAAAAYSDIAAMPGKRIRFVDGVIFDSLLIGGEEQGIDVIIGALSGYDNKLNLVALSQKLAGRKEHLLVDIGVEPFRFDITNYVAGVTPCDYCRNLHDLAVTEAIADDLPNCDRYPTGSTVFANSLGNLSLVQAMRYVNPALGRIATGSVSGNLLAVAPDPSLLYNSADSLPVDPEACAIHRRTSPIAVNPGDYDIAEGFRKGWHTKVISTRAGRQIGEFAYVPRGGM